MRLYTNLEQGELADESGHVSAEPRVDEREKDVPPQLQQVRADGARRLESARERLDLVVPRLHRPDEVHHARLHTVGIVRFTELNIYSV